jgi:hypothetical protein
MNAPAQFSPGGATACWWCEHCDVEVKTVPDTAEILDRQRCPHCKKHAVVFRVPPFVASGPKRKPKPVAIAPERGQQLWAQLRQSLS